MDIHTYNGHMFYNTFLLWIHTFLLNGCSQWFKSLPTTRENFKILFGECPYCNYVSQIHVHVKYKSPCKCSTSKEQITTTSKPHVHFGTFCCTHVQMNIHLYKYMYMDIVIVFQSTNYKFSRHCGFNSIPIERMLTYPLWISCTYGKYIGSWTKCILFKFIVKHCIR